ncbi:hypothetical protein QQS21_001414 [Conoideocrella luteorostrata]|uniref:RRM domain-containing protein n=1 Tax=Conoideocrella luteorostrata TaxID=1105319 RepID=A0AAJ0FXL8_9HYPO|nr:hypothetical protein QQS21_001414 [Conoideocrella luteorostrata]
MSSVTLNPDTAPWVPKNANGSSTTSDKETESQTADYGSANYGDAQKRDYQHVGFVAEQSHFHTPVPQDLKPSQNGMLVPNTFAHGPFSSPWAGLPVSHSYQSVSTLMSPGPNGRPGNNGFNSVGLMSPDNGRGGTFTEPRNYAPRTSGMPLSVSNEPPPKFDLSLARVGQGNTTQSPIKQPSQADITYGNQNAGSNAVIPFGTQQGSANDDQVRAMRSNHLNRLTATAIGLPTLQTAMQPENFPFMEAARQAVAVNYGVVKLKNIPFATKRSEVIAFLGRNSKILNDSDEPVHIIMERVTSKTMDAYVEFVTLDDANKAVEKHHHHNLNGRVSRLGDRPVDVELSSQENLMKDLFPLAKGIVWNGAVPKFKPFNPHEPWDNFKGFVSEEEMVMLVKHVEVPHRSPFSKDCPQRPYECLISTLKKFPWYATDRITISQRRAAFKATCELARLLSRSINKEDDPVNLNMQLHRRLINAAMKCPGFTPMMKDDVACIAALSDMEMREYNQPRFAHCWRHQYTIASKPDIPLDVLEWYIAIIREQTQRDVMSRQHAERTVLQEKGLETDMYWGYFWAELGYVFGPVFDQMSLSQAAHAEFSAVERVLGRALPSQ